MVALFPFITIYLSIYLSFHVHLRRSGAAHVFILNLNHFKTYKHTTTFGVFRKLDSPRQLHINTMDICPNDQNMAPFNH